MRFCIAFCLAWALACASGEVAAPDAPDPDPDDEEEILEPTMYEGYIVIVAGDKDPAAAQKKFEAYKERGASVGPYPMLVDSIDVEGLKPGFHIVVAGVPSTKEIADQMASAIGENFPGTYVRQVRMQEVENVDCAYPGADPRCFADPWEYLVVFDRSDGMTSEDWAFFTDEVMNTAKKAGVTAMWLGSEDVVDVQRDGKSVGHIQMAPYLKDNPIGYVFAKEGQMPSYQEHAMVDDVLEAAEAYFGRELR